MIDLINTRGEFPKGGIQKVKTSKYNKYSLVDLHKS